MRGTLSRGGQRPGHPHIHVVSENWDGDIEDKTGKAYDGRV